MPYEDSIVVNGKAINGLAGWTTSGVAIKTKGDAKASYFELATTAAMEQTINIVDMNAMSREYKVLVDFFYSAGLARTNTVVNAFMVIKMTYLNGLTDTATFPLVTNAKAKNTAVDTWYTMQSKCFARGGETLSSLKVRIFTQGAPCPIGVDDISLQRSATETELHNDDPHGHNLPLSVYVGPDGIKGTKGTDVSFHLKADGSATFAGTLEAADGVFKGTVYAQNINTVTAKISTAQIEDLVVGGNVTMGPLAYITWGQVGEQPFIPTTAGDVGALPANTYIPSTADITTITANYIATPNLITNIARVNSTLQLGDTLSTGRSIIFGSSASISNPVGTENIRIGAFWGIDLQANELDLSGIGSIIWGGNAPTGTAKFV